MGIIGAIIFTALWIFCAHRRQRQLSHEGREIPWTTDGPLAAEVEMEEPYAEILSALNAGVGAGRSVHFGGGTNGEVAGRLGIRRASFITSSLYSIPGEVNGGLPASPLSPLPSECAPPSPSTCVPPFRSNGPRRRSSPGPDASAWFGGYNVILAPSASSQHSHSLSNVRDSMGTEIGTMRTENEVPLLGEPGSRASFSFDNHFRFGPKFSSPDGSMSAHDLPSTSSDMRYTSRSLSDILRNVSSLGAWRSTSSHEYGYGFASTSSGDGAHQRPAPESSASVTSGCVPASSMDGKPAGVRAFLGRLRRGHMQSLIADSSGEPPRDRAIEKGNVHAIGTDTPLQISSAISPPAASPIEIVPGTVLVPTSPRYVLSNPDLPPSSPYVKVDDGEALQKYNDGLQPPTCSWLPRARMTMSFRPSPAHSEESYIAAAEGILHPRLRDAVERRSHASLRDFEDYSRPIGGVRSTLLQARSAIFAGSSVTDDPSHSQLIT